MNAKEYLSGIRWLLLDARSRRRQAQEIDAALEDLQELREELDSLHGVHNVPELMGKLGAIRAGAEAAAGRMEAEAKARARSLDRLQEPARSVLRLYWARGLSFREVAQELNYSEFYVRQVHCKALRGIDSGKLYLSDKIAPLRGDFYG